MISEEEECINKVIQNLSMGYSFDIEDNLNESLDESIKVLDLYLKVDLNRILKNEFKKIRDENSFELYTPEDINDKIIKITENCVREMKVSIRGYIMIVNKEIFLKTFESKSPELKQEISNVVKKYVQEGKSTKDQIDKIFADQADKLEERLRNIIKVGD
jgi:hypothetical protein